MVVYNLNTITCWKKKLPLSNGNMADYVQRTVLLKVPSSNSVQSMLGTTSNKWTKNRKHWILGSSVLLSSSILTFTYKELEKATASFHEVLGVGASGLVYKGQLEDELKTNIAVKKIDKLQPETEEEFMVEVQIIGQMFHKNLVRLLGFCNEGTEKDC
ncbi:hypothetical protein E2562_004017 [Oryza meyeriana var. granulata]|uniref:non-specific serine/threonine protein kinase n=1 Tax=Oryza meyeriana var. granulata TaxID=110450 RepID=A0A6G1BJ71_9ORYZ|nr:hypothetical protein E2562_004017 [Oryza meyeriana var. granulata]